MKRLPFILGNWKMNRAPSQSGAFVSALRVALESRREQLGRDVEVALAPAFPALDALGRALEDSGIGLAAQNVHSEPEGAYTGEVSVSMLEDLGCHYALVGHSERRQLFGESDRVVAAKVERLLESRIDPILCVGETLEEREAQATLEVVGRQLAAVLDSLGNAASDPGWDPIQDSASAPSAARTAGDGRGDGIRRRLVVAYEPVWAIGTGRTATPELAQAVHASIRETLVARLGDIGRATRILYGGSVKPSNARDLLERPDIDGALVGGASLEPETFAEIILSALPLAVPAE